MHLLWEAEGFRKAKCHILNFAVQLLAQHRRTRQDLSDTTGISEIEAHIRLFTRGRTLKKIAQWGRGPYMIPFSGLIIQSVRGCVCVCV